MQDAPIIVYAEHLNEIQDAQSNNSICVFVLKSELKIEVLEEISESFRPTRLGGMKIPIQHKGKIKVTKKNVPIIGWMLVA